MCLKVAVVSTDGKVINQHFGRAQRFLIFEIKDRKASFLEIRKVKPACNGYDHTDDSFNAVVSLIKDCYAVFASRIGPYAADALLSRGIKPYEAGDYIEDILKEFSLSIG